MSAELHLDRSIPDNVEICASPDSSNACHQSNNEGNNQIQRFDTGSFVGLMKLKENSSTNSFSSVINSSSPIIKLMPNDKIRKWLISRIAEFSEDHSEFHDAEFKLGEQVRALWGN